MSSSSRTPPKYPMSSSEPYESGSSRSTSDRRTSAVLPAGLPVQSPHATLVVDEEGRVVSMNALAARLLQLDDGGYSEFTAKELLGFTPDSTPSTSAAQCDAV